MYNLVTGAGGTIGSELCKQLDNVIALGHGENSLYHLDCDCTKVVGDIRDARRMNEIFMNYDIKAVYHAAAHKHVPMMEDNVNEAISNNVYGTQNVVQVARQHGVERLIYISTDKAVEPICVMGLTKRLGELIALDAGYTVVRFGNVAGSRGSVIPAFKRQIEEGGPVTVTHPDVERYFMTVQDAVKLVLKANGNFIYVLEMGKPVKILDLAKKMIDDKDVDIEFIGLRKGEKLTEKLWYDFEQPMKIGDLWII